MKILIISGYASTLTEIESYLGDCAENAYELKRVESINQIRDVDLPSFCDAVILDVREERGLERQTIRWVGETHTPVALICLCKNPKQVLRFSEELQWIDDCIAPEGLLEAELFPRIERAVRRRVVDFELERDQELLCALLDNTPDAIYFKDRDCRFIRVNDAQAAKYGKTCEEMIGKSDYDFYPEEEARKGFDDEHAIMRKGERIVGKIERKETLTGEVRWMSTTKLPLKDRHGDLIGTMGISRDITEQVENLDALNDMRRQIEEAQVS